MMDENKSFKEKVKDFLDEKGVYILLLVCIAVVGGAFMLALPKQEQPQQPVANSGDERLSEVVRATPIVMPTPKQEPATPIPEITPKPDAAPKPTAVPAREKAVAPVKGRVQWRFAVDELVYSRTLDQWMTHRGIDLAAPKGSEVRCPWAGVVEEVYEDDSLGITVVVKHSGDLESRYSNLRKDCPVKEGDKLSAGALIGNIGETAVSECGDDSHLHFETHKKGEPVDPEKYIVIIGG